MGNRTAGSNPTLSANLTLNILILFNYLDSCQNYQHYYLQCKSHRSR